jgi:hypothetical protein
MSENIAFWGIFDVKGQRHLTIPYVEKQLAEDILAKLNHERKKELYYCTIVKEAMINLPKQLVKVDYNDRLVKIPFVTPDGEKRLARKTFRDITIHSVVQGKFSVVEYLTVHRFKGELRIKFQEHSWLRDSFDAIAEERWPNGNEDIMMLIDEL